LLQEVKSKSKELNNKNIEQMNDDEISDFL
jgi:hypothetical protein